MTYAPKYTGYLCYLKYSTDNCYPTPLSPYFSSYFEAIEYLIAHPALSQHKFNLAYAPTILSEHQKQLMKHKGQKITKSDTSITTNDLHKYPIDSGLRSMLQKIENMDHNEFFDIKEHTTSTGRKKSIAKLRYSRPVLDTPTSNTRDITTSSFRDAVTPMSISPNAMDGVKSNSTNIITMEDLNLHLAVSLRINNSVALRAVLEEKELLLDAPLSIEPVHPPTSFLQATEPNEDSSISSTLHQNTYLSSPPGLTALGLSILYSGGSPLCIKTLLEAGANIEASDSQGRTALHWAVLVNETSIVRYLLSQGANISTTDMNGDSPLHICCQLGNHILLSDILSISSTTQITTALLTTNTLGHTPVCDAVCMGHWLCLKLLIKAGADPLSRGPLYRTLLHIATIAGSMDCAKLLLKHSPSVREHLINAKDQFGTSAILCAAGTGNLEIVSYLFSKGANIFIQDNERHNIFHYLTMSASDVSCVLSLVNDSKNRKKPDLSPLVHIPGITGITPIHLAATTANTDLIIQLLDYGCTAFAQDDLLRYPLVYACLFGCLPIMKLLYVKSSNLISHSDLLQMSPIHFATRLNSHTVLSFLIQVLEKNNMLSLLNQRDCNGLTALAYTTIYGHMESFELLLCNAGTNYNIADYSEPWTPLHQAIARGHTNMVSLLLKRGAKFDSSGHFTAIRSITIAVQKGYTDVLRAVLENGYSPNTPCIEKQSLLHLACDINCLLSAQLLISYGAHINSRDASSPSLTPLDVALLRDHKAITELLNTLGASTSGSKHHFAAGLIQLRWRFCRYRMRRSISLSYGVIVIQKYLRGYLVRKRFRNLCKLEEISRNRAARIIQIRWREFSFARRRYKSTYETLRTRLFSEKKAFSKLLQNLHSSHESVTSLKKGYISQRSCLATDYLNYNNSTASTTSFMNNQRFPDIKSSKSFTLPKSVNISSAQPRIKYKPISIKSQSNTDKDRTNKQPSIQYNNSKLKSIETESIKNVYSLPSVTIPTNSTPLEVKNCINKYELLASQCTNLKIALNNSSLRATQFSNSLSIHTKANRNNSIQLKHTLQEALNEAIRLRSETDQLKFPQLASLKHGNMTLDPNMPPYHLKI